MLLRYYDAKVVQLDSFELFIVGAKMRNQPHVTEHYLLRFYISVDELPRRGL